MTHAALKERRDATIAKLRELVRLNVDSAKGFEECAELIKDHGIKQAFIESARDRRQQAQFLATPIEQTDRAGLYEGSYIGALHRSWLRVREACSSDQTEVLLTEVVRGEEAIAEAYQDATSRCDGSSFARTLSDHSDAVNKSLEQFKNLLAVKRL